MFCQFLDVVIPEDVSIFPMTSEDMGGVLSWVVAPGALSIILFLPTNKGHTYPTVVRAIFGNPSVVGEA